MQLNDSVNLAIENKCVVQLVDEQFGMGVCDLQDKNKKREELCCRHVVF
jgi:hypothetical protein